jgi:predicted metal-binding membrane protein
VEETSWRAGDRIRAAQAPIVVALVAVAGLGWVFTGARMAGMHEGPGTDPGSLGSYVSVWIVMMAAMMLPSAAPMVVVHSAVERRRRELGRHRIRGASMAFVGGYLLVWSAFGVAAYALFELARSFDLAALSWNRSGRDVATGVIAVAAVYQLTPLKDRCLAKCRSPLGFVVGSWRPGRVGAARMGMEHGAWCVGCCWALMATLFALGVMSLTWTIVIAAVIAVEKVLPWKRGANVAVVLLLIVLALGVALVPNHVPGLTIPADAGMPMDGAPTSSMGH